jgi:hypothetical protein
MARKSLRDATDLSAHLSVRMPAALKAKFEIVTRAADTTPGQTVRGFVRQYVAKAGKRQTAVAR